MKKTEVSVIMPVYNGAAYIKKAIESVLIQKVPLELIVIDDGSTDETAHIVTALAEAQPKTSDCRIIYVKNDTNLGAAASRNKGVAMAASEWIAFLDADDWWESGKLRAQLKLLRETGCVLCCTARALVDSEGRSLHHVIHVKSRIAYKDLLFHNSINCSSVVVRREVMAAFPMCHEDSHEDYISWLQILRACGDACGIDRPYLRYRVSAGSKSGNKLKSAGMTFKVYRYMGFGLFKSVGLFISYALHGVMKYALKG